MKSTELTALSTSAIIVDDEPLACSRMRRLLSQVEGVSVIGEANDGEQALKLLKKCAPDIVFLDIEMPKINGLDVAKTVVNEFENPPAIIFCTAYDQFAIKAFDFSAAAYLLKPVMLESLKTAIKNATRLSKAQLTSIGSNFSKTSEAQTISLSGELGIDRLPITEVLYFRSEQKHIVVSTLSGGESIVDYTLDDLQNTFSDSLIRVHRNALLNKTHLSRLRKNEKQQFVVELSGSEQVFLVSRRHLMKVKQHFK